MNENTIVDFIGGCVYHRSLGGYRLRLWAWLTVCFICGWLLGRVADAQVSGSAVQPGPGCYTLIVQNDTGATLSGIGLYVSGGGGFELFTDDPGTIATGGNWMSTNVSTAMGNSATVVGSYNGNTAYNLSGNQFEYYTMTAGNVYYFDMVASGVTSTTTEATWTPASVTNTACVTLANNTGNEQYYQFTANLQSGSNYVISGCSSNLNVGGQNGNGSDSDPTWIAVHPGESFTVCYTGVWNGVGSNPFGGASQICPALAAAGLVPCQQFLDQPRCVTLCSDGLVASGSYAPTSGNCGGFSASLPSGAGNNGGIASSYAGGGPTNNTPGTNGMQFLGSNAAPGLGLYLELTGMQIGAQAHQDALYQYAATINGNSAIIGGISNVSTGLGPGGYIHSDLTNILQTLKTNSFSTTISNLSITNGIPTALVGALQSIASNGGGGSGTNWPTNFPDAALIEAEVNATNAAWALSNIVVGNEEYWSNQGVNLGAVISSSYSNKLAGTMPGGNLYGFVDGSAGASDIQIAIPTDGVSPSFIAIGLDQLPSGLLTYVAEIKNVIGVIFIFQLWVFCLNRVRNCMNLVQVTNQVSGSGQAFLGFNASIGTGAAYAGILVSILAAMPAALFGLVTYFSGYLSGDLASALNPVTTMGEGNGMIWSLVTAFIPVNTILVGTANWLVFEFVGSEQIVRAVSSIKMFMIR